MPGIKRKREAATTSSGAASQSPADSSTTQTDPDLKTSSLDLSKRRTIFVRSLAATTTNESLITHFSNHFPLKHATVVQDPTTKISKGFGFATLADSADVPSAITKLQNSLLDGKKIRLETAEPRHRDLGNRSAIAVAAGASKAGRVKARENSRPPRLIVRNLPWSVKEPKDLERLFLSYGKVKQVTLPKGKGGLQSGFGFVTIRGEKNAERALESVNGVELDGRTLAVDWAVEKGVYTGAVGGEENGAEVGGQNGAEQRVDDEDDSDEAVPDIEIVEDEEDNVEADIDKFFATADLESESDADEKDIEEDFDELPSDDSDEDSLEGSDLEIIVDNDNEVLGGTKPVPQGDHTIFIRNLPYTATDASLNTHFSTFGPLRYARIVLDPATQKPKGTGFACFFNAEDLASCLRSAPRPNIALDKKKPKSVLQDERIDPSGRYTMDGRVLQVSAAVSKGEAAKLSETSSSARMQRDRDRRRLYLLMEGTISSKSPLHSVLSPSETKIREASLAQRKKLISTNPSLNLSLTRLSIRNIPRSVDSKALKALARDAVVSFAKDVKDGKREKISKEELSRDAAAMAEAERKRKARGKGVVKQAKVVFEGGKGEKVKEDKDVAAIGRSRGYGFVEYSSHRWALMGLRWLNGYAVGKGQKAGDADGKRRLIVEFAVENAGVVKRRAEMEAKSGLSKTKKANGAAAGGQGSKKRKTGKENDVVEVVDPKKAAQEAKEKEERVRRAHLIGRKRMKRKHRKG